MNALPTCGHCDEVIGAYELMVVIDDGSPHFTTRGRLRETSLKADEMFHGNCWEHLHGSLELRSFPPPTAAFCG